MQASTLNPIVMYAAHVWDAVWAFVLHQLARRMYQCDVRHYVSDFQSIDDLLSSFALAPTSTTALHTSFVEDKFDLDNAIQTKAEFPYAIAVMDNIGGWEEEEGEQEKWVSPRFDASIWIHTKAAVCIGQGNMQNVRIFKLRSIL